MSRKDKIDVLKVLGEYALTQNKKAIWDNILSQALCTDLNNQKDWENLAKRFCEVM